MRSGRRKVCHRLAVLGVITAVISVCVRLLPHPKPLLARATRGMTLEGEDSYWLLSAHEALIIRDKPNLTGHWQRYPKVEILRQNLKTQHRVFIPALSALYNSLLMNYNYEFQPHPDGKWLLLVQHCIRIHESCLTTVDGAQHDERYRASATAYSACWLRDGQHWAEIFADQDHPSLLTLLIHNLQVPLGHPAKIYYRLPVAFSTADAEQATVISPHQVVVIDHQYNADTHADKGETKGSDL